MKLDGKASSREGNSTKGVVALNKVPGSSFTDEWDYVINNYTIGANDPYLIDSIGKLAFNRPVAVSVPRKPLSGLPQKEVAIQPQKLVNIPVRANKPSLNTPDQLDQPLVKAPLTNEQKFKTRTRQLVQEIPVSGDSLELRFYDNAEIDGDSIAVFLNDKMLVEHVRLSETAYIIKLPVAELQPTNDLVMVAENLGSIPPNTSLMIAMVDGKRYEARLASTEGSSALVRFVRKENGTGQ